MNHHLKGQMVFEFVVAAIIFFAIVFYSINHMNSGVSSFSDDMHMNNLEARAVQISELMVHNPGMWDGAVPLVLGLSKEWPVLNSIRIMELGFLCDSYFIDSYAHLLDILGLKEDRFGGTRTYDMSIIINETGNPKALVECGLEPPEKEFVNVERFALSEDGKILRINVWLW